MNILPPERTPWDVISKAIGQQLSQHLPPAIQQGYNRGMVQKSFNNLDPNADFIEQLKTLAPVLNQSGVMQAFGAIQKSREGEARNKQFADIFGNNPRNGSQNQPGAHGVADQNQNVPDFSNISDDKLAQLSIVDPQRANALRQIVQNQRQQKADKQKADIDMLSNDKFSEGYRAIQDDDMDTLNNLIKDPNTPYEVKNRLSNLKNQHDVRKDVKTREIRTRQHFLQTAYSKAINFEKKRLDNASHKNRPAISERIKELVRQQRKDMKKFSEDPESYPQLSIWDNEASQYLPEEESEQEDLGNMMGVEGQEFGEAPAQTQPKQGQKIRFDSKNPNHTSYAKRILDQEKGDRKKANEILAQEFIL